MSAEMVLTSQLIMAHLGHAVKLVNTFGELNGTLFAFGTETLQLTAEGHSFRLSEWAVFTEKPAVVIPVGPGYFFDCDGDPIRLGEGESPSGRYAPYKPLRPEGEVAAEVLAELDLDLTPTDNTFYERTYSAAELRGIFAKYGVTL